MNVSRLIYAGLLLILTATGCTSSGQSGNAFVFLTVELFSPSGSTAISAVTSGINDPDPTIACARLSNNLKNPTVTAPTGLDNITITSYTVRLTRSDGVGTPGPFTFSAGFTVPAGTLSNGSISGNSITVAFIVVPPEAKGDFAGGPLPLTGGAEVVFKGRDGRGQTVEGQGAITVTFAAGNDPAVTCPAPTT